jgi:hypothetical protein
MNAKPISRLFVTAALLSSGAAEAAPIRVRLIEETYRGFLVLRSVDGTPITYGEVSQKPTGNLVDCHIS